MKRQHEDKQILLQIQLIKSEHPFWGYRRVWAYMKYRLDLPVNKKRIYRIMKEQNLLVTPNLKIKSQAG